MHSLKELSDAATPGEWHHCQPFQTVPTWRSIHGKVPAERVDYVSTWPGLGTPPGHRVVVPMPGRESVMSSHDMAYVARLVSEHRAGRLHDDAALAAAEAKGRAAVIEEAAKLVEERIALNLEAYGTMSTRAHECGLIVARIRSLQPTEASHG